MSRSNTQKMVYQYLNSFYKEGEDTYNKTLADLLSALNWRGDCRTLRGALPLGKTQLSVSDILNVMANLGYSPQAYQVKQADITPDLLPCFFVPSQNGEASAEVIENTPDKPVSGRAYYFSENHAGQDIGNSKTVAASDFKWFTKLLMRFKGVFKQVLIASLLINILMLATPLFMMSVYDNVIGDYSPETLIYLVSGILLAVFAEYSLRLLRARSLSWFGARLDYIVSNMIVDKLVSLPAAYTERASVAAQLARIKAFESVREFFTGSLFLSFIEFPFTLILITVIAILAGPIAFIPVVITFFYVVLLFFMFPKLQALTARMANAKVAQQNMHIETLGKQETLRYAGGHSAWQKRYQELSAESAYAGYRYTQTVSAIDSVSHAGVILGGIATIYFGVGRIWADQMSMGALIAVLILIWRTLSPIQVVCMALPRLSQVRKNITQINRLMDLQPEISTQSASKDVPTFNGKVEFHTVGLRYDKNSAPVYSGLSFTAEPGMLVGVMGGNSTGKSTTLQLISGLYHPQAGAIRIDDTDIRQIDPLKLRQNIAYVEQEPGFFTGTIKENMQIVRPDATDKEIMSGLDAAGLSDWVKSLPMGLDTPFQAKKNPASILAQLALARAIIQDTPIMLIDEMPYEFLNGDAGAKFYDFLKGQKGKKTIFFVTYRQDYIALADMTVHLFQDERPQIKKESVNGQ